VLFRDTVAKGTEQMLFSKARVTPECHRIYILKGIVYPKMKVLSLFTHTQVVPNLYGSFKSFFC